jgi:hypothetical protein
MARALAVAVALVACASPRAPRKASSLPAPTRPPLDTAEAPVAKSVAPRPAVTAPHGGVIVQLAIAPNGAAALSCDERGGIRLWPTLDGSREPVIVDLPHPKALALGAGGDAFTVYMLDDVRALLIVQLAPDGVMRTRALVPGDAPFVSIAMTERGLLALRSDQTIALYGLDGAQLGRIGGVSGEQVVAIAAAGLHAAAIVNESGAPGLRSIELGSELAWGPRVGVAGLGDELAISPSGRRLATIDRSGQPHPVFMVIDRDGKPRMKLEQYAPAQFAFLDDDHVVVPLPIGVQVLDVRDPPSSRPSATNGRALAVANKRAIASFEGELMLGSGGGFEYLGYGVQVPEVVRADAAGELVALTADAVHPLDAKLELADRKLAMPKHVVDMVAVGGDDWVVVRVNAARDTELDIVDAVTGTSHTAFGKLAPSPHVRYEPGSRLVTLANISTGTSEVLRYDPAKRALATVASLAETGGAPPDLLPLSPASSGGLQLVRLHAAGNPVADWVRDAAAPDRPEATMQLDGHFAAFDPAGHVYATKMVSRTRGIQSITVYDRGAAIAEAPAAPPGRIFPDPSGKRFLVTGRFEVAMYGLDGKVAWERPIELAHEAVWSRDGRLVLVAATGLARIDPDTGAVLAARCGWHFGLSKTAHPFVPRGEPVCAQVAR